MGDKPAYQNLVREGERVYSTDDQLIGSVDQVRAQDFILHRLGRGEVCVPYDAIQDRLSDRVRLKVRAELIDRQGWQPI